MEYVYDYMFHLLNEYAKLLTYRPTIPRGAVELCPEEMVCNAEGLYKKFMMESLVKSPSDTAPCTLPLPYDPPSLASWVRKKEALISEVERSERRYWSNQPIHTINRTN